MSAVVVVSVVVVGQKGALDDATITRATSDISTAEQGGEQITPI